ncbi:hypothetical protein BDR03DRAFT_1019102 [Suillus americanus]|nr:hypothetical protein BDR03DRAFT_1019102 [Suillus americanus]
MSPALPPTPSPSPGTRGKAEGSKKRKSPLISGLSSQPPKSAMKSHKHQRSGRLVKSKCIVESEDDEDLVVQPLLRGVPEVVLPWCDKHISTGLAQALAPFMCPTQILSLRS